MQIYTHTGFPGGSVVKNPTANAGNGEVGHDLVNNELRQETGT